MLSFSHYSLRVVLTSATVSSLLKWYMFQTIRKRDVDAGLFFVYVSFALLIYAKVKIRGYRRLEDYIFLSIALAGIFVYLDKDQRILKCIRFSIEKQKIYLLFNI